MGKILALTTAVAFAFALSSPTTAATIDISAAKKKVDCTMEKNKMSKACKGKMDKMDKMDKKAEVIVNTIAV
jgi:hypothetical protein